MKNYYIPYYEGFARKSQEKGDTEMQVYSHGRWPVKKLREGQTIRFRSKDYGNEAIVKIERICWSGKVLIVYGSGTSVAFRLDGPASVEIVTVIEE